MREMSKITSLKSSCSSIFSSRAKRKGGVGEMNFCPSACRASRGIGWEAARPCVSKESKPAKFHSLIERNFAGFVPPSGGGPLGGGYSERSERQSDIAHIKLLPRL